MRVQVLAAAGLWLIGLLSSSAVGQPADLSFSVRYCATNKDDAVRLKCFDALAAELKSAAPAVSAPVTAASEWQSTTQRSEIAGTEDVYLSLAGTKITNKYGKSVTPGLYIRCAENKTSAYIDWSEYLGIDDTRVEWRVDDAGPRNASWSISSDHQATGLWSGGPAIPFIKSLLDKKKLVVRVVPYGESPVTSSFNITGLREIIGPMQKACKWS